MFILALWPGLLDFVTGLIGAVVTTSTLFFFALLFLMLINIQFSVEISSLRTQVKNLAQQLATTREGAERSSLTVEGPDDVD
jgi:ABC-type transport system involved in Fe-S cluster assembly fused permease/ATPase subunit